MVATSCPSSGVRAFVASRPPLVLFTLCLIAFAITTFTFAYYVEHNNDLPNIDAHKDWVSFLKYLSDRRLCVAPATGPDDLGLAAADNETAGDTISIAVDATLDSELQANVSGVRGRVLTADWVGGCPTSGTVRQVVLWFGVPAHQSGASHRDVCVMITGPKRLLSPAASVRQCKHLLATGPGAARILDGDTCTDGATLTYKPSPYNSMLLSLHDRSIINLHLFHTSYFMLVMAITLICYAMIRGKPAAAKHQQFEKVAADA